MMKSVVLAIVLSFVVLTTGSVLHARQDGGLPELEPPALEAFLVPFRQAVLHRVAVAWNHTITDSAKLEADMQTCSNQIKSTVKQCKTCATNACTKTQHVVNSSPAFTDYLLLATQLLNPLEFLKGPLNEIGDKFGDIVDLLGSGGASFIDSMSSLGNDIGGAFTIEIDPTSLSGVSYTKIYITGNIKGNYVRYQSKVIYDMMNLGSTANNIAEEFWNLWM
ncbi:hypothetical protein ACF0H5_011790 [Mactra antiquata]